MKIRITVLFLLLGTAVASHQKHHKATEDGQETNFKPRYSAMVKGPHTYILEPEDEQHYPPPHGHPKGGQASEYVDSEEVVSQKENEEAAGNENLDKNVKEEDYNDHSEKSAHQGFQAGGISFDKHLKDHKADNKEVDNVKAHDASEKFGGEAVKEHKLGKHKEKSKGHKLHGFKNVYHKEEYGDHKTFHDEFLDSDHQHNYDDQHEHKEMHGGKVSKAFKHEGKNKKFDKGDEKREWGKEEFDGAQEGKREKGGQSSKHRHGAKKHQGRYDANKHRSKNAVHKVSKGTPPPHNPHAGAHGGHHGPHQAQIQPYVSHYNHQQQHVDVPHHHSKPHAHQHQAVHVQHEDDDNDDSNKNYGNSYHDNSKGYGNGYHDSTAKDHENYNHDDDDHGSHGNQHHSGHHEYSEDDSKDHDSSYEERAPRKHHHKSQVKERLTDKKDDKLVQKFEPVVFKKPISTHYGIHQYRQPVYQEEPKYNHPEPIRREKFSSPFQDKYENHRIRYGFHQPRNHFHHSHHQQHNSFPRFSGFSHSHHNHGYPHHGGHNHHFQPMQTSYAQPSVVGTEPQKVVSISSTPQSSQHLVSQRY